MLELDLLLTRFVDTEFETLGDELRQRYLELLGLDDFEIWDWLQGMAEPPEKYALLIERISNGSSEVAPRQ